MLSGSSGCRVPDMASDIHLLFDDFSAFDSSKSFSSGLFSGLLRLSRRAFDKARFLADSGREIGSRIDILYEQLSTYHSRTQTVKAGKEILIHSSFGLSHRSLFQSSIIRE